MNNIFKTLKRTFSLFIMLTMLFNMALIASAAKSVGAEMKWTADFENSEWVSAENAEIFSATNFEPGSEIIRYFKIENTGTAAFLYEFKFSGAVQELADVIDVYYATDVTKNLTLSEMECIGALSTVVNGDAILTGKMLPEGLEAVGYYTEETNIAVMLKMQDNSSSEYMGATIGDGFTVSLSVTKDEDFTNYPIVDKFEIKLPEADFLYRVGNQNTVALGSLFKAIDDAEIGEVSINFEAVNSNVTATYTKASDWTKGTIQFAGTGPVKLTISDDDYCNPLELMLEVVDAVNSTTATSATSNNVVLLNDAALSTMSVSKGYTFYGNGFKLTAANDVMYDAMGVGFVTLNNGTLDNVQIICPNFSYSIVYDSQIKSSENTAVPSDPSSDARGNVRSAVMVDGNSKIVNSFVHGGRAALFVRSGNILVENSTISGGATANIHAISAKSLTLRNATLIQKPFKASVNDTSKTIMGLSGLFECDENGDSTPLILEGTLIQDAWINESHSEYVPSAISGLDALVKQVMSKKDYTHDLDGDGTPESVNIGFTYVPQNVGGTIETNVTDNRIDIADVPYDTAEVSAVLAKAKIYSYKSTKGTSPDFILGEDYSYTPNTQGPTAPAISFTDINENRIFETEFDDDDGWTSSLTVNLDDGNYDFNFSNLMAEKNGEKLNYTVKTEDGTAVDKTKDIPLTDSGVKKYILTIVDNEIYGANGEKLNTTFNHTYTFVLTSSKSSIPEPEAADTTGGTPLLVVESKNSNWSCAIPALEGIKIKYWTSASNSVILDLATLTPTSTGKQNGTNNYWEYSDGYKLKVTCGYIHEGKQIYGMPVVVDNNGTKKMYFTISSTNGYVSTSTSARAVTLTYDFTDPNGKTLKFSKTWQFIYADYKNGKQYSYSDFVKGTLKEASSGCVTGDTLVTLADGSQKRIDEITVEDKLLVWDFYNGDYDAVSPAIIFDHGCGNNAVIKLKFEDGTELKVVNLHQIYDITENKFVNVDVDTVESLKGHEFVKMDGEAYQYVKLSDYEISEEYVDAYGIISAKHYNIIAEGILTTDFEPQDYGLFNYFEVANDLTFDLEKMDSDVEKYGLYTYEDFEGYLTPELFELFNVKYMKVAVGKGQYTYEGILGLIEKWIVNSNETVLPSTMPEDENSSEPAVINDEPEDEPTVLAEVDEVVTSKVINSASNTIKAAVYSFVTNLTNAEETDGGYIINDDNAVITLTAEGASTGYAIITVDGDTYYTAQIKNGEAAEIEVKNAKGQLVTVTESWGTHEKTTIENNTIDLGQFYVKAVLTTDTGAEAVIANTTKYDRIDVNVYIAVYNKATNRLVAVNAEKVTIKGKNEYTISVPAVIPAEYEIKAFLWDDDMKPVK